MTAAPRPLRPTAPAPPGADPADEIDVAHLEAVTMLARSVTGLQAACTTLFRDGAPDVVASAGTGSGGGAVQLGDLVRLAVHDTHRFSCTDLAADPRLARLPEVDGTVDRLRSAAATAVVVDGLVVGSVVAVDRRPRDVPSATLDRLGELAGLLSVALAAHRDHRRTEQLTWRLQTTTAVLQRAQAFSRALLDALPVGVVACDTDGRVTTCNRVALQWGGRSVAAGDPRSMTVQDWYAADRTTPLRPDDTPLAETLRAGAPTTTHLYIAPPGMPARTVASSGAQILDERGRLLGAVAVLTDVSEQLVLEDELRRAAQHDVLTGLPNRRHVLQVLSDRLSEAGGRPGTVSVAFCDLDGFKAVNDTYGHHVGDQVLTAAARRLTAAVRPGDAVARLGGDEFVVVVSDIDDETRRAVAARISEELTRPMRLGGDAAPRVGVSVGWAVNRCGETADQLLTRADAHMYEVKAARRRDPRDR